MKTIQRAEIAAEFSRNHYVECTVYDEMVEKETVTGYAMEHEAIHGLMHQEFVMYLQPVIEMESGSITGAEALVGGRIRGRGLLQPERFPGCHQAEAADWQNEYGYIPPGLPLLKREADKGRRMRLLFNFTVENVGDEQFPRA